MPIGGSKGISLHLEVISLGECDLLFADLLEFFPHGGRDSILIGFPDQEEIHMKNRLVLRWGGSHKDHF